jgi:hypothetical protein
MRFRYLVAVHGPGHVPQTPRKVWRPPTTPLVVTGPVNVHDELPPLGAPTEKLTIPVVVTVASKRPLAVLVVPDAVRSVRVTVPVSALELWFACTSVSGPEIVAPGRSSNVPVIAYAPATLGNCGPAGSPSPPQARSRTMVGVSARARRRAMKHLV